MTNSIKRNQAKKAEEIFERAMDIVSYKLDSGFKGVPQEKFDCCGKNWLFETWKRYSYAQLFSTEEGKWTLRINDNYSVEFKA